MRSFILTLFSSHDACMRTGPGSACLKNSQRGRLLIRYLLALFFSARCVERYTSSMTSFLLCADSFSGKFPVLTDCFAGDLLLSYCLAAVFITRYLPRWSLHCKISSAAIFIARIFTLMESLLCDIRMRPGKETRDTFQDCTAAIKAMRSPLAALTLYQNT